MEGTAVYAHVFQSMGGVHLWEALTGLLPQSAPTHKPQYYLYFLIYKDLCSTFPVLDVFVLWDYYQIAVCMGLFFPL